MISMELAINQKFKGLIPPIAKDEFDLLKESIVTSGVREPILTWQGVIIDGHNRYAICQKYNIPFETKELSFADEDEAVVFIIKNQLGRRNLTDFNKVNLALQLENVFKDIANKNKENAIKKAQQFNPNLAGKISEELFLPNLAKTINTREEIAKIAGVGYGTIYKVKKIKDNAVEEIKQELSKQDGKISINAAEAISSLPKDEQKKIINELDEKEIIRKAKEIKQARKDNTKLLKKKEQNIANTVADISDNPPVIKIMDCRDYLQTIPDNSIDLLLTDPPYSTDVDNIAEFANSWLTGALKKVKPTGRAFIFIGAYPVEIKAYLDILLKQDKFILDSPLIWSYKNTHLLPPKNKYNLNYQVILHLYSEGSKPLQHNNITSETFAVQEFNAPDGRLANRFHHWQKPMPLAEQLVRQSTERGEKVLDLFACTGTFLIAASKLGRIAEGCEIDKENAKIAETLGCKIGI